MKTGLINLLAILCFEIFIILKEWHIYFKVLNLCFVVILLEIALFNNFFEFDIDSF